MALPFESAMPPFYDVLDPDGEEGGGVPSALPE